MNPSKRKNPSRMTKKEIMTEIERLMNEFQNKGIRGNMKSSWYALGKADGLNLAWKMLKGSYIKEEN